MRVVQYSRLVLTRKAHLSIRTNRIGCVMNLRVVVDPGCFFVFAQVQHSCMSGRLINEKQLKEKARVVRKSRQLSNYKVLFTSFKRLFNRSVKDLLSKKKLHMQETILSFLVRNLVIDHLLRHWMRSTHIISGLHIVEENRLNVTHH